MSVFHVFLNCANSTISHVRLMWMYDEAGVKRLELLCVYIENETDSSNCNEFLTKILKFNMQ